MKLIKVKGIVIKEVNYSDSDKIITVLTDNLGVITCMAKGARKIKSSLLTSSQFLVYSEFVLFKGTSFYHVNSASSLSTFYKLRTDYDKMIEVFEVAKLLNKVLDEYIDSKDIISLFLNLLYSIENLNVDIKFLIDIFKLRLFTILGFVPDITRCNLCKSNFFDESFKCEYVYYNYVSNNFCCPNCKFDKKFCIKLDFRVLNVIRYICYYDIKKIYLLKIDKNLQNELDKFTYDFVMCVLNNM